MSESASAPMPAIPTDTVTFASGGRMPLVGFGTWQLKGREARTATNAALEAGYRHLDTATIYGNEGEVGRALRDSGVPRADVFVTTKCPPSLAGQELETLERSLELLGTDHVDLWLIHWTPHHGVGADLWEKFVEARERGLARDIGVSNYRAAQIDELAAKTGITPVVNQVKWSPLLHKPHVVEEHRERGIALEGYSGLRGGALTDPTIGEVAGSLGRTPAQVIVRWHLQHGIIAIPKSGKPDRIRSNADVGGFELTREQMAAIDALGEG
jgi:2,5-diketo-D-gluconate reductase A